MNRHFLKVACLIIATGLIIPQAWARPQRLEIKSLEKRQREARARTTARTIELTRVQDLETRRSLQTLFDQLGLESRS